MIEQDVIDELIIPLIKKHEGCRLIPYQDEFGNWSWGWGHEEKNNEKMITSITQEQADAILYTDVLIAIKGAQQFYSDIGMLSPNRQAVLVDMAFNMGYPKLSQFHHMQVALINGDFDGVATAMEDSDWFDEVKIRGVEDCRLMREG